MSLKTTFNSIFSSTPPHRLLVVDDDTRLRNLLQKFLTENGFTVDVAESAADARDTMTKATYDLMVLDVMMPGETGLSFTESIRESKNPKHRYIPILLLTALGEAEERIEGLESGADDYLSKPFEPRELVLRIENLIERCHPKTPLASTILKFGSLTFDVDQQRLFTSQDEDIRLTTAELDLLLMLAESPRESISRDELAEKTGVSLSPRTIDVQITRLRKKIEADPRHPKYLRTIRHKGYALWPD